jgi:hypothetical protein
MTHAQQAAAQQAVEILDALRFLESREEFQGFLQRLRNQADAMADTILHDDTLAPELRERLRHKRLGLLEALGAPMEDAKSAAALLKNLQADPDEIRKRRV